MRPRILNMGFTGSSSPATAEMFMPLDCLLVGLQVGALQDTITDAVAWYLYVSLSGSLPSFTQFPSGTQNGLIAHWRGAFRLVTSGSHKLSLEINYTPLPGIPVERGASVFIHSATSQNTMNGVVLFHILER